MTCYDVTYEKFMTLCIYVCEQDTNFVQESDKNTVLINSTLTCFRMTYHS